MSSVDALLSMLRCPVSGEALHREGYQLVSESGRYQYAITASGIPLFAGEYCFPEALVLDTYHRAYQHARQTDAPLNQLIYNDMKMYLESDILFKVDRATMAASLEARVPLLNRDLVEHVMQLPLELKLRRLTGKYIFRKAVAPLLPAAILKWPKKGFNMPVAKWFKDDLRELLLDTLSESAIKDQGLFVYDNVKQLIDDHLNQRRDNRKELWTMLMFQLWYQRYLKAS